MEAEKPYIVYIKVNEDGYIISVNSSAFLSDTAGWIAVDSGFEDKHLLAQGNYFPKPIIMEEGTYRYKLADGKPAACTERDIMDQKSAMHSDSDRTQEKRIETLEAQNEFLMQCILEMSEILYA